MSSGEKHASKIVTIISLHVDPYDQFRYGKPWIAKVNSNAKPYMWGEWIQHDAKTCEGTLVIYVEEGDIIGHGQKDTTTNTSNIVYELFKGGMLHELSGKAEVHRLATFK